MGRPGARFGEMLDSHTRRPSLILPVVTHEIVESKVQPGDDIDNTQSIYERLIGPA